MAAYAKHPLLLAAAVAHTALGFGHTAKGLSQFSHPSLSQLPRFLRSNVQAGWYEGSVFFVMLGILNYKWAQTGLVDTPDKALATLIVTLLFGAGGNYIRTGDKPTGIVLSLVGILQTVAARGASL
ncbi:hypothetical protein B0J11DRAFT_540082 [Dendryphion nanum]|uniref:Uncharacterized protein n=1 Tax=Dendryphion nanum TaxID=256645 RepID=A0A9P9DA35_9PLEO|nr:hypothetical protein B0J11DRAFT_540082 [Dendryphion nanum]